MTNVPAQPANNDSRQLMDAADIASAQRVLALHRQYPGKSVG